VNILLALHAFPPECSGGTERTVEALARAMQDAGHRVTIAAGSLEQASTARVDRRAHGGLDVRVLHRDDLWFERWEKAWSPGLSQTFAALLAELAPDVVHVHHWIRLTSDLVRCARAAGCVAAVTMHDYFTSRASPVRRADRDTAAPPDVPAWMGAGEADEAFAFHRRDFFDEVRAADLRFAPSQAHADGLRATLPGDPGAIAVTPPPLLRRPARARAPAAFARKLVTWGTLYPEKGLDTVLEALRAAGLGWQLEVFGEAHEPGYREALRARAQGLPVRWRGAFQTEDLETIDADLAVLPSLCHESYGLTMDEALCLGLPVIASDLPSYRERAPAASCAFFPAGDAHALAALLGDARALRALQRPQPPPPWTAAQAAAQLLAEYERARAAPRKPYAPEVSDRERARAVFRRAERRFWSMLQQPDVVPPPDGFPAA
jgi:glycosyltransferase involved in cell wall biosynthesis